MSPTRVITLSVKSVQTEKSARLSRNGQRLPAKSRVIPAPRRVFWVNGKLHVFAGGDAREIGGAIFQLTAELISRNSLFARHPQRSVTLLSLQPRTLLRGLFTKRPTFS
jgi:hypothetical protein